MIDAPPVKALGFEWSNDEYVAELAVKDFCGKCLESIQKDDTMSNGILPISVSAGQLFISKDYQGPKYFADLRGGSWDEWVSLAKAIVDKDEHRRGGGEHFRYERDIRSDAICTSNMSGFRHYIDLIGKNNTIADVVLMKGGKSISLGDACRYLYDKGFVSNLGSGIDEIYRVARDRAYGKDRKEIISCPYENKHTVVLDDIFGAIPGTFDGSQEEWNAILKISHWD